MALNKVKEIPGVAIIIVNWNGFTLLKRNIPSVLALQYPKTKMRVIVVDNGSKDKSIAWLKQNPEIEIISLKKNVGFAIANNIGIKHAFKDRTVEYIITLNNDTEVEKNWLKNLVNKMSENTSVGAGVGKILKFEDHTLIDSCGDFFSRSGFRIIKRGVGEKDNGQYDKECEVLSACAAAAIFRRKALEQACHNDEYFDETFVNYIEDVDLSFRIRLKGWQIYYFPSAIIYHAGSATSSKISRRYKDFVSRRNRIWFALKVFPLKYAMLIVLSYIAPTKIGFLNFFNNTTKKTQKKLSSEFSSLTLTEEIIVHVHAILSAILELPIILKKRHKILSNKNVSDEEIERWIKKLKMHKYK